MSYEVENILPWTMKTKEIVIMQFAEIADNAVSMNFFNKHQCNDDFSSCKVYDQKD